MNNHTRYLLRKKFNSKVEEAKTTSKSFGHVVAGKGGKTTSFVYDNDNTVKGNETK